MTLEQCSFADIIHLEKFALDWQAEAAEKEKTAEHRGDRLAAYLDGDFIEHCLDAIQDMKYHRFAQIFGDSRNEPTDWELQYFEKLEAKRGQVQPTCNQLENKTDTPPE